MPFEYRGYQNPYVGTIGELMRAGPDAQARAALAIGDAQARAALQSGAAWSGAIQTIAQAASGAAGSIMQEREQAPIRAQNAEIRGLQIAGAKREASAADRLEATKRAVNGFMNDPDVINPDGTFNLEGMGKKLAGPLPNGASGPTEAPDMLALAGILQPINATITQARDSQRVYAEHQTNALARLAGGVLTLGAPTAAQPEGAYLEYAAVGVAAAVKSGQMTRGQADQFLAQVAQNPEVALKSAAARSTVAPIKLGKDDRLQSGVDPTQTLVPAVADPADKFKGDYTINDQRFQGDGTPRGAAVPEAPGVAEMRAAQLREINAKLDGTTPISPKDRAELEIQRGRLNLERQKADQAAGDKTDLTPEGLDAAAQMFAKTGQLPALGNADKNTRKQIINRAAVLMPGLDIATAKADYAANTRSLTTMQGQRDAIGAFEKTAGKNIDIFLEAAGKVVDTGSPLANTAARLVSGQMLGSTDQAAYDAARQVAINEIAKITSNPTLAGTLSDSARHEVDAFNPENATLKQSVSVMRLLKRDMGNRISSIDDGIGAIQDRIKKGSAAPAAAPAPAAGLGPIPPGQMRAFDPQGKPHTAPIGTPLPAGWKAAN